MLDLLIHKILKKPYLLYVRDDIKPKKYRATIILIHGIGNSGSLWSRVIKDLPQDVRIVTLDLLGFGKSPKPSWATYSAKTQARSVIATLRNLRLKKPVILVGYSLGGLISVEMIKSHDFKPEHTILLSPPFYRSSKKNRELIPSEDKVLKDIYRAVKKHPEQLVTISKLAMRYGLVDKEYGVGEDTIETYMGALESSIINQTSYEDALSLNSPITILHGRFDPVVVYKNLKKLSKNSPNIKLHTIIAGHTITNRVYNKAIVEEIKDHLEHTGSSKTAENRHVKV